MKALQVIESAYRCTLEEQDDPVVWITHAMKGAGAELDVLLRGNSVNYAVKGQDASGLSFGDLPQTHPPQIERDIRQLTEKGVSVYVVRDDADDRGIRETDLLEGVHSVRRPQIAELFSRYDQVWHW
jgi:sulfur transfer complex TusBCD TusB component (DsrH family)